MLTYLSASIRGTSRRFEEEDLEIMDNLSVVRTQILKVEVRTSRPFHTSDESSLVETSAIMDVYLNLLKHDSYTGVFSLLQL